MATLAEEPEDTARAEGTVNSAAPDSSADWLAEVDTGLVGPVDIALAADIVLAVDTAVAVVSGNLVGVGSGPVLAKRQ